MKYITIILMSFFILTMNSAHAGNVKVVNAKAIKKGSSWHFNVTLKHADTGWEHYADAWRVVTEDGKILGERTLHHPHVDEQPFTRGLSNVKIPAEMKKVYVIAHDKVHGWTKERFSVFLD